MGFTDPNPNNPNKNHEPSPPPSYLESMIQNHPIVSQSQTAPPVNTDPNNNPSSAMVHPPNQPYQIPDVLPQPPQQPMNIYSKQDQHQGSQMNASMVSTATSGMGTSSYMMNSQHQQQPMPVHYPLMNQHQPPQQQQPILPQQQVQQQQKVMYPTLNNITPPMQQQQPILPQPMMPPQRPYVQPMMVSQQQPMMVHQPMPQPIVRPPSTTTTYVSQVNYVPPQPVVIHPPQPVMVSQMPLQKGRTVVTTTTTVTPNPVMIPPPTVQIVHGKPPTMPPGAMGYSTYYPQHATPGVPQTTIYVQHKKKKSSFDKFMFGE